ncbi:MAG: hypothetical protein M0R74_15825 [Dehalococcoidia bacterium]|nr:hypothetical protein [Dehalococcoidia bacterium]
MPSYLITDPNSGNKLKLTGDSPPTEQELNDIFSKFNTEAQQEPAESSSDLFKGGGNLKSPSGATRSFAEEPELTWNETGKQAIKSIPSSAVKAGKAFVDTGRMIWRADKALYNAVTNPSKTLTGLKDVDIGDTFNKIKTMGSSVFDEMIVKRYGSMNNFKKTLASDPVGVMFDVSTVLGGVGGITRQAGNMGNLSKVSKAGQVASKMAEIADPTQIAAKAISGTSKIVGLGAKGIDQIIDKGIVKSIRPSVSGQKNYTQIKQYTDKARDAVKTIMGNKDNLVFTTEAGEQAGRLPQNLREFSQALDQTKGGIFKQYNKMAQDAGEVGAKVDLNPITNELEKIISNKTLNDLRPEVVDYANSRMVSLMKRGEYTTEEAQDAIKILNSSLEAFYKNPTYETASKAYVDSLIANNLRSGLDSVIENLKGPGYQELKNKYGSLKAIEKDVNRAAVVDSRKNIKGLIDFSDVFSGYHLVQGLLSVNPQIIGASVASKGIAGLYRHLNNPNRIVKSMFSGAEKVIKSTPKKKIPLGTKMGTYQAGKLYEAEENQTY